MGKEFKKMEPFIEGSLRYISLEEAEEDIRDGWLAQFRGTGFISRAIQSATGGLHSHSAMFRRHPHTKNRIDILEMREFHGGRIEELRSYVHNQSAEIDIFRIDPERWPDFDGAAAVAHMLTITTGPRSRNYSYWSIFRILIRKMPVLWRAFTATTDDELSRGNYTGFCSHCVAEAHRVGGGVDPVPRLPDHWVDPNHLTRSLLYNYHGTVRADGV